MLSFLESEARSTRPPKGGGGWRLLELERDLPHVTWKPTRALQTAAWEMGTEGGPGLHAPRTQWAAVPVSGLSFSPILPRSLSRSHIFLPQSPLCHRRLGKPVPRFRSRQETAVRRTAGSKKRPGQHLRRTKRSGRKLEVPTRQHLGHSQTQREEGRFREAKFQKASGVAFKL